MNKYRDLSIEEKIIREIGDSKLYFIVLSYGISLNVGFLLAVLLGINKNPMSILLFPVIMFVSCIILLFILSNSKQRKFKRNISSKFILPEYHFDRKTHIIIIDKFLDDLYWSGCHKEVRTIIEELDDISFEVLRLSKYITMNVDNSLFGSFDKIHCDFIFRLNTEHYLYSKYNKILCDSL